MFKLYALVDDNKPTIEGKLHCLMYSLLYPAVLGTMLVACAFASQAEHFEFDYIFYFAVFLGFYFSSQHVENALSDKYSVFNFILDVIEIILICGLFLLLNFYEFKGSVVNSPETGWRWFYLLLIVTFVMPLLARAIEHNCNIFIPNKGKGQSILSIMAVCISIFGVFCNTCFGILIGLSFLLFLYFCLIVRKET